MALVDEQRMEVPPEERECRPPHIRPHTTSEITRWLRTSRTIWCPGCSNGMVTRALIDAVLGLELDPDKVVVVAGIGCSGRISQYLQYSTVHAAHGRALAVATGVIAADPSLHVIVAMGDGDCSAIGGNHFIHAARRNIDLTALVFNNSIYGMTGGQMSPTTHRGDRSTTSARGNVEAAFDLCQLAHAAGATYVARGTAWGYRQLVDLIAGGINHRGFSMVEAMSVCPVYYGRFNLTADPAEFLRKQKEHAVKTDDEEFEEGTSRLREEYPVGVLHHAERDEFVASLARIREQAQEAGRG
jgi:2-oxoglutarate/2-oxoacid ferredoxin oxidoreductase subunit beta